MSYGALVSSQSQYPTLVHEALQPYGQLPGQANPYGQSTQSAVPSAQQPGGNPPAFSITEPPAPATSGDVIVFRNVESALTAQKTEDKVNGLIKAAMIAESQLPKNVRTEYNKALFLSTKSGKAPNFNAVNAALVAGGNGKPPPGPFTVWYLDAFLYLMSGSGQRAAGKGAAAAQGHNLPTESPIASPVVATTAAYNSQSQQGQKTN